MASRADPLLKALEPIRTQTTQAATKQNLKWFCPKRGPRRTSHLNGHVLLEVHQSCWLHAKQKKLPEYYSGMVHRLS